MAGRPRPVRLSGRLADDDFLDEVTGSTYTATVAGHRVTFCVTSVSVSATGVVTLHGPDSRGRQRAIRAADVTHLQPATLSRKAAA